MKNRPPEDFLESKFSKEMRHYHEQPDFDAWKNISNELDRRKRYKVYRFTVVVLILLLGTAGILLLPKYPTQSRDSSERVLVQSQEKTGNKQLPKTEINSRPEEEAQGHVQPDTASTISTDTKSLPQEPQAKKNERTIEGKGHSAHDIETSHRPFPNYSKGVTAMENKGACQNYRADIPR